MLEIGSSLREARSRAGLELAEVEAATMIPGRYLSALEDEQFERLPAGPYRRSFLVEYAAFLGLDAQLYASEYTERFAPPEPEPPAPARRPVRGSVLRAPSARAAGVIVLVVLAGVAVWQLGGGGGSKPLTPPVTAPSRSRPAKPATTTAPAHPPTTVATTPRPPAHRPALTLTAARGPCWLLVRFGSGTGAVVYERTLEQGQTVRFGLGKRLWIRLGAPWNLDAAIAGRTVTASLPARTGDVVATGAGVQPAA